MSSIQGNQGVSLVVTANTKFIISTSGRVSSLKRYKHLLQSLLNVDVAYIPISSSDNGPIKPENFAWALRGMNCIGGAISKDIKHGIIPFLDVIDVSAASVNSVNTVIVSNKNPLKTELIGYNTDVIGFKIAIQKACEQLQVQKGISISRAVCYGYGGVTSVVVEVLRSLGIYTFICGRRLDEAAKRAAECQAGVWSESVEAELFINATPVTDKPLEDALNFLPALQGCSVVFDHEMPGKCLQEYCSRNSVIHISGYEMYYPQMVEQWHLFLEQYSVSKLQLPDLLKQADSLAASEAEA